MQTECISGQLEFEGFDGRRVVAAFDGGAVTSDAGALLLRETDRAIRLIERVAACFSDGRDPGQLIHALPTQIIACSGDEPDESLCARWRARTRARVGGAVC